MSQNELPDSIEIETGPNPVGAVIWMHGLGADAHDFEPIVPELVAPGERALRFVFPNAPVRPVTVNNGYPMRAWFDIIGFDGPPDEPGTRASAAAIRALIRRETDRGLTTNRIVLAGFSQGGAMALFTGLRHTGRLAGIMGLSCFDPLPATLAAERTPANAQTPIFLAHGTQDPIVPIERGRRLRDELEALGYPVEWHEYPMPHTVALEEVQAIAEWLRRVLPAPGR